MLAVRLSIPLEKQFTQLAEQSGHSKSYLAKCAIANFIEDQADYRIALARIEENLPSISLAEVKKNLGLDDDLEN